MSVVFNLKDILGVSIFVSGGNKERKNGALDVVDLLFSHHLENESYQSDLIIPLTTSPILSGDGSFVGRLISLLPIYCMCLI